MLTYETIKMLCVDKGVTITGLEKQLGFARGSLCKVNTNKPSMEKVQKLADYFSISVEQLVNGKQKGEEQKYYLNDEITAIAQDIFENKELRVLFDADRDAESEDLTAVHNILLALKRKEREYNI